MGYRGRHQARRKSRYIGWALGTLPVLALLAPFVEPWTLEVETTTLTSTDLPRDIARLKIVYLTDIHQGKFYSMRRVQDLVTRVNSLNPDIILLGGDYANTSEEAIAFFENAPSFHARYLTAAVLGNHDRTEPESNLRKLEEAMYAAGVTPLVSRR